MGNFLTVIPVEAGTGTGGQIFESGLAAARDLKQQAPHATANGPRVLAATFSRANGTGSSIACDPATGSWLLAAGTWFHTNGLASGDESRLLEEYLRTGPAQLAAELQGFFNIVVGDARSGEVVVITDIAGSCHSFIRELPGAIAISGSSLLLAALDDFTPDPFGCQEFLYTGIIYQERTFYREVRKLGPASIFWFSQGKLRKQERYWSAASLDPEKFAGDAAVAEFWETLTAAAQKIARRFPHPVSDLTGGYDSRIMVAGLLAATSNFGTTVSGPADSPDVLTARALAAMLKLEHLHFPPEEKRPFQTVKEALSFTDGEYDLVDYARIASVHRRLAQQFDLSINGSYGEIARGYWWELLVPRTGKRERLDAEKVARNRYALKSSADSVFTAENRLPLVKHFTRVIEETNAELLDAPNTLQMDNAYLVMRMQRWQGRIASSTNQLWPCLSPFMFRPILEVMLQTQAAERKRSLLVRKTLARFHPPLANFPLEHGYPAAPATWRNLLRFTPLLSYYGEKVIQRVGIHHSHSTTTARPARLQLWEEAEVRELLDSGTMKSVGLLDRDGVGRFLDESQRPGFSGNAEWQRLLSLEYTLRRLARKT